LNKQNKRLDLLILSSQIMLIIPIFVSLHVLIAPDTPIYFTSCLPNFLQHLLVLFPFSVFYWYIGTCVYNFMLMHFQIQLGYGVHIVIIISNFRVGGDTNNYFTLPKLRQISSRLDDSPFLIEYRTLELVNKIMMEIIGSLIFPVQA
jgi:hypothetical protein